MGFASRVGWSFDVMGLMGLRTREIDAQIWVVGSGGFGIERRRIGAAVCAWWWGARANGLVCRARGGVGRRRCARLARIVGSDPGGPGSCEAFDAGTGSAADVCPAGLVRRRWSCGS